MVIKSSKYIKFSSEALKEMGLELYESSIKIRYDFEIHLANLICTQYPRPSIGDQVPKAFLPLTNLNPTQQELLECLLR